MHEASHVVDVILYIHILSIMFITLSFLTIYNLLTIITIWREQIRTSKGRRDLKNTIIKVLKGQLDEKGKTDEEKCDVFKHTMEDLKFYNGDYQTAQPDQKENGKKTTIGADSNVDDS